MDKVFVSKKPLPVKVKEEIPVFERPDLGQFSEKDPKLHTRLRLGKGPKPPQTFSLDVVEAALDQSNRPGLSDRFHHRLFSIHGDTEGIEALGLESFKPRKDGLKAFPCAVNVGNDSLAWDVHEADMTAILVKVSPIIEEVAITSIIKAFIRCLLKPVVTNAFNFGGAVAGKIAELADRIAFFNPKPKPMSLTKLFILRSFPNETFKTFKAPKSLLSLLGLTIAFDSKRLALGTMLFLASLTPCLLNRFN